MGSGPLGDLGRTIEARWKDKRYEAAELPEIAEDALREFACPEHVDAWSLVDWMNRSSGLPKQEDVEANFSNLPLTVFRSQRFYVSVLYWLDATTVIHQHAFSGAFQVLLGSSLHSEFEFEIHERLNTQLLTGALAPRRTEVLAIGDVRRIDAGSAFIHSLFHLDGPSATIVVRTYGDERAKPQYTYLPPSLAVDPFYREEQLERRLQGASLLLGMRHSRRFELLTDLVREADVLTAFRVLERVDATLRSDTLGKRFDGERDADRYRAIAFDAHGTVIERLPAVFDEQARQHDLVRRRSQVVEPEQRFFLALLLNGVDRAGALELVARRYPGAEPAETLLDWIEELSSTRLHGSDEPNVLGVRIDDDILLALEDHLTGASTSEPLHPCLTALRGSALGPLLD